MYDAKGEVTIYAKMYCVYIFKQKIRNSSKQFNVDASMMIRVQNMCRKEN